MRNLSLLALFVAACSSAPASMSQKSVGTAGGTVTTSDGAGVVLPMGAVAAATTISITPVTDPAAPTGTKVVGTGYLFGPEGATFAQPVTITLAVTPSQLPAGKTIADVSIYTAPQGTTTYTKLETVMTDATHVSAATNHFSIFVPAATGGSTAACTATCTNTTSGCTCTATCESKAYTMTCYNGDGCTCAGKSLTVFPTCSDTAALNSAWTSTTGTTGCGFPGTIAAN